MLPVARANDDGGHTWLVKHPASCDGGDITLMRLGNAGEALKKFLKSCAESLNALLSIGASRPDCRLHWSRMRSGLDHRAS